jgi:polygalacturonase
MAVPVLNGKTQFLDAAGVSLGLGSVSLYVPGTTTPKQTWQDQAKTVLNTTPTISLDAGGYAIIYGSGAYRQIVKDVLGNTIWDQVAWANDYLTDLVLPAGAGLVGASHSNTYAQGTLGDRFKRIVYVTDAPFLATGDGSTDDTAAIQAAATKLIANGGGVLFFPPGSYKLTAPVTLSGASNVLVSGYGATLTATTRFQSYLNITGTTNLVIDGLSFDQAKSVLATYTPADYPNIYNCGVYGDGFVELTLRDCRFTNLYTVATYMRHGTGMNIIDGCSYDSPAQTQTQQLEHVMIQTCAGDFRITKNRFVHTSPTVSTGSCGVFVGGLTGSIVFRDNYLSGLGRDNTGSHRLGAFDCYGDAKRVYVIDNIFESCMAQCMRLSSIDTCQVQGNRITLAAGAELDSTTISVESVVTYFGTGQVGCDSFLIADNVFIDGSSRAANAIALTSYDWGAPLLRMKVRDNIQRSGRAFLTMSGPFLDVGIESNQTSGRIIALSVPNGPSMTSVAGTEANATYEKLAIRENSIIDNNNADANGIDVELTRATTAFVGMADVDGNRIRSNPAAASAAGIRVRLNSTVLANSRALVRTNDVQGYALAFDAGDLGVLDLIDNRSIGISGANFLSTTGSITSQTRRGNRLSTGAINGRAGLSAGSAVVSTAEVLAGDNVLLSRVATGGTTGDLSVSTIIAGTSFTITSTSGTETSTIFWEIVH